MAREWHGGQAEGRFLPLLATADPAEYSAEGGEVAMEHRVGYALTMTYLLRPNQSAQIPVDLTCLDGSA